MRWIASTCLLIALLSPAAQAEEDVRATQISAAATEAFDHLRSDVLSASLGGDLTVDRFLARLNAGDQIDTLLQTAQQIGGTRWLDEQTVEVRLELHGDTLAKFLEDLADKNPKNSPMSVKSLHEKLKRDFSKRIFSATGACAAASAADRLRPDPSQLPWRSISDKDRIAAINAARHNVAETVIDSLRPIEWGNGRHLNDALSVPAVHDELSDWLLSRPITSISFRDDLEVRISLAAAKADFWPVLKSSLEKQSAVSPPHDPKQWENLKQMVITRMTPARGTAPAQAPAVGPPVAMPQVPAWASGPLLSEEGVSRARPGGKLRTARAAQDMAESRLRTQMLTMPMGRSTIGELIKTDPRLSIAFERAIGQVRLDRVQYDTPEPGAVRVRVILDPIMFWREISR